MHLLVLGGGRFVGPALLAAAGERGWRCTALSRSGAATDGARHVPGDRAEPAGLAGLGDQSFDVVVDTWSGAPRVVRASAAALAGRARAYGYISSRSVYSQPLAPGADESAPLVAADPGAGATDYPADKRGGEMAVEQEFGPRHLLVRAGLILGPGENVGRLPWWLRRIAAGGDVLAPGPPDLPIQYVDARDLAAFTLDALAAGRWGPYNVVSRPGHTTMGELLEACVAATGSSARLRWLDPGLVLDAGIAPWTELPIWLPPDSPDFALHQADTTRAYGAGLACRPVTQTVADTWAWLCASGPAAGVPGPDRPVGLDRARELATLRAAGY